MAEDENGKIARVEIRSLQHLFTEIVKRLEEDAAEVRKRLADETSDVRKRLDVWTERLDTAGEEHRSKLDNITTQIADLKLCISNKRFMTEQGCADIHSIMKQKFDEMQSQIDRWRGSFKVMVAISAALGSTTIGMLIKHLVDMMP